MTEENETIDGKQTAEKKMYNAMAECMQSDGVDVTAEEIEQKLSGALGKPSQPFESEEQTFAQMVEAQQESENQNPIYVVRGAQIRCQYGSHSRCLNLPECHGVYILKHPVVFRTDSVGGTEGREFNIRTFGICECPENPSQEEIILKKESSEEGGEGENISGKPCIPEIIGEWEHTHTNTHIGKEGEAALTTRSFIMCKYGGLIRILRSGQEYTDE